MLNWMWMTLISGILFGFYDIFTKKSLEKTPLLQVLAFYSLFNFILVSFEFSNALKANYQSILLIFIKAFLIFLSWICGFIAIRGLPISIISPFGTLTPMFSILLGLIVLKEHLVLMQIIGIIIILSAYYLIGKIGAGEVSGLFKSKYLYLMVGSTFLASLSTLIDKFVLRVVSAGQMQFWFSLFVALMYISALIFYKVREKDTQPLRFNYFIILMSLFLVISDRIYFSVVKIPASQIAIVIPLRRISIFISTIVGGFIFNEKNLRKKFLCACLLIIGIAFVFSGK